MRALNRRYRQEEGRRERGREGGERGGCGIRAEGEERKRRKFKEEAGMLRLDAGQSVKESAYYRL